MMLKPRVERLRRRLTKDVRHTLRPTRRWLLPGLFAVAMIGVAMTHSHAKKSVSKGYDITPTGLTPHYPKGYECSPLTSLYASMIDVDGGPRDVAHSGVDGGRLGEPVLAPAPGKIIRIWEADWGWGDEGALLVLHTRKELNLESGPPYYFSAYYHLKFSDLKVFAEGDRIERGQKIGKVYRPGGRSFYLPEVHLEVYEVDDPKANTWSLNELAREYWENKTSRLIDPLYLMALDTPPDDEGRVTVQPYDPHRNYATFKGFSYFLPCRKK